MEDLAELPFLPTALFKRRRLFSLPRWRLPCVVTSSGTSGRASEIGFSVGDLWAGLKMVLHICRLRKLLSWRPCHYVVFGYQPRLRNRTGVSRTAFGVTLFTPALSRTYALRWRKNAPSVGTASGRPQHAESSLSQNTQASASGGRPMAAPTARAELGDYVLDLQHVQDAIVKHSKSRFPLRFMGFPAYAWFLMKRMEEQGVRVRLPKGSKLMLGGGWKQFYAEEVDKSAFYALAKKVLGLDDRDIIEFFGAVEHPIFYNDCERHHFHIPVYSRVLIRDPATLKPVPNGTPGLVNLITPMDVGTPLLSVMTDDLGILHDAGECGCGLDAPWLEILGRVGLQDIKTCAAGAAEILNKVEVSL
ncbi:MAG: acyl-protein synthetase [Oscillospiraceae bacterium]|nr:acyl-protein synthetase [Oscillospiraceae bacterium]